MVGVNDGAGDKQASVIFRIVGDNRVLWKSGVMRWRKRRKESLWTSRA